MDIINDLAIQPVVGELITSMATENTYTIGEKIGEGFFGCVYRCTDVWNNDLAVKVLKQPPHKTLDDISTAANQEFMKLRQLRHPYVTYVFDAFVFRDTFYIVTERCYCPVGSLFTSVENFCGPAWLMPIARCLLQAVNYLHLNQYVHQDIHLENVFVAVPKSEMSAERSIPAIHFKLGDLGTTKLFSEVDAYGTLANWIRPPEAVEPERYGPMGKTLDIYHLGLFLLQLALSKQITFTREEILAGRPREMALELPMPFSGALEKALRRRATLRTATAMELWRDLNSAVS